MKLLNKFLLTLICAATVFSCQSGSVVSSLKQKIWPVPAQLTRQQQVALNVELMNAAERGDLQAVQQAVAAGANIHVTDDAALRSAAIEGHLPIVQYLVEHGADIRVANDAALQWAAEQGHLPVVQYLIEHGADIHALNDGALRWAARYGHLLVVQYLLEHGADIHALNDDALQWAAGNGHLAVVQFLVEHGADIHARNDEALRGAAERGHWAVAEYLLQHAADQRVLSEDLLRHLLPNLILPELQTAVATNNWHRVEELLSIVPVQGISADLQQQIKNLLIPALQKKFISTCSVLLTGTQIANPQLALITLSFIVGPHTRAAFSYFIKEDTHEITQ